MTKLISISILLAAIFTLAASAPAIESSGERIVTTSHQIKVGQKMLRYTARAGLAPIRRNETGEIHGHMFFIAYLLDRLPNEPARPLTFLWNGGPGANSTRVHHSGVGPKRIKSSDDPAETPDYECELEDNQTTWFDQTDLVFVDPIGTGFSRPTKAEYAAEFYNTLGDIASVAEFVRVYLTRFDAWDAPLFIGGESYGVWRAAGVAEALAQRGRFTGLDASLIDRQTLIVARRQFAEQLMRDRKQELGRFDTRQIAGAESRPRAERNLVINKYLRSTLKFKTDLAYQGIEEGFSPNTGGRGLSVGARWDYNQGPPPPPGAPPNTDAPPGGSQPWLRRAMAIDPSLKAFVAAGLYDSLNSCAGNDYLVSQLEPELKRNITARCYAGGHAMYESPGPRRQLKQDIGKFIQDTVGGRLRPQGARP